MGTAPARVPPRCWAKVTSNSRGRKGTSEVWRGLLRRPAWDRGPRQRETSGPRPAVLTALGVRAAPAALSSPDLSPVRGVRRAVIKVLGSCSLYFCLNYLICALWMANHLNLGRKKELISRLS